VLFLPFAKMPTVTSKVIHLHWPIYNVVYSMNTIIKQQQLFAFIAYDKRENRNNVQQWGDETAGKESAGTEKRTIVLLNALTVLEEHPACKVHLCKQHIQMPVLHFFSHFQLTLKVVHCQSAAGFTIMTDGIRFTSD